MAIRWTGRRSRSPSTRRPSGPRTRTGTQSPRSTSATTFPHGPAGSTVRSRNLDPGASSSYLDAMETTDPEAATLAAASSRDPELGLRAVAALRGLVEALEALQVDNARAKGWSWQDIAGRLGVSKQAVHQKHGPRSRSGPGR